MTNVYNDCGIGYAEDLEDMYSDGSSGKSSDEVAERLLLVNIIQRALLDIDIAVQSSLTINNSNNHNIKNIGNDAHDWIHNTKLTVDTPFSFVWCCSILYPNHADLVINKIREATKNPLVECDQQRKIIGRIKVRGNMSRDRQTILNILGIK